MYFPISLALAAVFAARQGGDVNYLIEPAFALGLLFGLLASAARRLEDLKLRRIMRVAGVVALACALSELPPVLVLEARTRALHAERRQFVQDRVIAWCRGQPQPILSLEPWLSYRSGVGGYLSDTVVYRSIVAARPDLDVITRRTEESYFATIILREPLEKAGRIVYQDMPYAWPRLRAAIAQNYVKHDSRGGWFAYRRRSPTLTPANAK